MGHNLEKVIQWLEGGEAADYRAGVLLLQEHSGNRSLVNMLLKKESAPNREKLIYELVKLGCGGRMQDVKEVMSHFAQVVQGATPAAPELVQHLVEVPAPLPMAGPDMEHLPEAVQGQVDELTQLMQRLYNERCQASNQLTGLEGDQPELVARILDLQNQYNALAEKRQRLVAGEASPAADEPTPAAEQPGAPGPDRAALIQERTNLRSRVSKAKKAAEAKPDDQLKAEKYTKLQIELTMLELQIKGIDA